MNRRLHTTLALLFVVVFSNWTPGRAFHCTSSLTRSTTRTTTSPVYAIMEKEQQSIAEETTEKYGLEAGLFSSLKDGNTESAQSLLKRYGVAYLATSIPLAIISFAICYALVSNGVDVAGLLQKVGVDSSSTGETAGTVALAYAAHKAASPIRFPPTVVLTPLVAKMIGREPDDEEEKVQEE